MIIVNVHCINFRSNFCRPASPSLFLAIVSQSQSHQQTIARHSTSTCWLLAALNPDLLTLTMFTFPLLATLLSASHSSACILEGRFKIRGQFESGGTTFSEYPHGGITLLELTWRAHWTKLTILNQHARGGITQYKKSRNLSIKIKTVSAQSEYNVAGPLNQNNTGRDH